MGGLGLGLGLGIAIGLGVGVGVGVGVGAAHRTCVALTKEAGVAASPPNLHRSPPPRPAPSTGAKWEPVTSMRVPAWRGVGVRVGVRVRVGVGVRVRATIRARARVRTRVPASRGPSSGVSEVSVGAVRPA